MVSQVDDIRFDIQNFDYSNRIISVKYVINVEDEIFSIRFDEEDKKVLIGCKDGSMRMYTIQNQKQVFNEEISVPLSEDITYPCTSVIYRPNQYSQSEKSTIMGVTADGLIAQYDYSTQQKLFKTREEENQILGISYNQSGSHFVTVGKDCIVKVYDESTKQVTYELKAKAGDSQGLGHNNRVFCGKFIKDDPNILITGGWDLNVLFWDLRECKTVRSFLGPKIAGESIDYKDGQVITGANYARNQIQLWDFGTANMIQQINYSFEKNYPNDENGAFIYGCQFSKCNKNSLVTGSSGLNEIRVFDIQKQYKPIGIVTNLPQSIYCVDQGNTSDLIAAGGADGFILILQVSQK